MVFTWAYLLVVHLRTFRGNYTKLSSYVLVFFQKKLGINKKGVNQKWNYRKK